MKTKLILFTVLLASTFSCSVSKVATVSETTVFNAFELEIELPVATRIHTMKFDSEIITKKI